MGLECWADCGGDGGSRFETASYILISGQPPKAAGTHPRVYDCMLTRRCSQNSKPEDSLDSFPGSR